MLAKWYIRHGNRIQGPLTSSKLKQLARTGQLRPESQISTDRQMWVRADSVILIEFGGAKEKQSEKSSASSASSNTHYEILGVPEDASFEEIRSTFRSLVKQYHPDRNPGNLDTARMMNLINEAGEVLRDSSRREKYDAYLCHIRARSATAGGRKIVEDDNEVKPDTGPIQPVPNYDFGSVQFNYRQHESNHGRKSSDRNKNSLLWVICGIGILCSPLIFNALPSNSIEPSSPPAKESLEQFKRKYGIQVEPAFTGWRTYLDHDGDSGIRMYEIATDLIRVRFDNGAIYTYSNQSAGKTNVDEMKRLAVSGRGLNTYINRNVRVKYER